EKRLTRDIADPGPESGPNTATAFAGGGPPTGAALRTGAAPRTGTAPVEPAPPGAEIPAVSAGAARTVPIVLRRDITARENYHPPVGLLALRLAALACRRHRVVNDLPLKRRHGAEGLGLARPGDLLGHAPAVVGEFGATPSP